MRQKPINTLNDLDSKEWVRATKSWFVINPKPRSELQLNHPAKFPEELVKHLLQFFTKEDSWVLDPFAGVGSTLIACRDSGRKSVGIELNPEFVSIGRRFLSDHSEMQEHYFIQGDARNSISLLEDEFYNDVPKFDFLITSPPYWDMLRKSRGGNDSIHKERMKKRLKQFYSESEIDIGNIEKYDEYIEAVAAIIGDLKPLIRANAYLAIIVQNMRDVDGQMRPIAWDLAKRMSMDYRLQQEMI
ncbi:site-specific DNA-methyltransferase, partial [Candidatus Thorarchaeota archaeon]